MEQFRIKYRIKNRTRLDIALEIPIPAIPRSVYDAKRYKDKN